MRLTTVHTEHTPQGHLLRVHAAFAAALVCTFFPLTVPTALGADSDLPITAPSKIEAKTQKHFTIGVEDTLDPWFFVQTFSPTVAYLREVLRGRPNGNPPRRSAHASGTGKENRRFHRDERLLCLSGKPRRGAAYRDAPPSACGQSRTEFRSGLSREKRLALPLDRGPER